MIPELTFLAGLAIGYIVATHIHSIAAAAVKLHLPSISAPAQPAAAAPLASGTSS